MPYVNLKHLIDVTLYDTNQQYSCSGSFMYEVLSSDCFQPYRKEAPSIIILENWFLFYLKIWHFLASYGSEHYDTTLTNLVSSYVLKIPSKSFGRSLLMMKFLSCLSCRITTNKESGHV